MSKELQRCQYQLKVHESLMAELGKEANASLAQQSIATASETENEDLMAVIEENDRLKDENVTLQQRLAELSLQVAAVSQVTVGATRDGGGIKVKASRLDGLC
jgi:regulator of replication initiation timing